MFRFVVVGAQHPTHLPSGECTRVQAETMPGFFSCKAVGEKPPADFGRDAMSIVDDVNLDITVRVGPGAQCEAALPGLDLRQRLLGVCDKVYENLCELYAIAYHGRYFLEFAAKHDAGLP